MEVLHPKLVHLPLALSMLMPLLGGAIALSWWRGWLPRRVWAITLLLHMTLTLSAFAAMQSGEDEQNIAEKVVSGELIRAHEDSASALLWLSVVALFAALIATIAEDERTALRFAAGTVIISLGVAFFAVETGGLGGDLVYKHGAARAFILNESETAPKTSPKTAPKMRPQAEIKPPIK